MNDDLVKQRVATATLSLASRFQNFVDGNHALLTDDTQKQLREVIADLHNMTALLGGDLDIDVSSEEILMCETLEYYANEFDSKEDFLRKVSSLAEQTYDSPQRVGGHA